MSLQSQMASDLFLSPQYVSKLTRSASKRYKAYTVAKRNGGTRMIFHPSRELKSLQRWLLKHVIVDWPVHSAASAYRPGRGIRENAEPHKRNSFVLKLDFVDFFPSISAGDIESYLRGRRDSGLQWSDADVVTFLRLVCRNDNLTIGAPTSPAISNAVCYELDNRISTWSSEWGIAYTRYADDITLSCSTPDVLRAAPAYLERVLRELSAPRNLRINADKTRHLSLKQRRIVTGLILTPTGELSVGRHLKRRLRAMIHEYELLDVKERRVLAGLLAYAGSIEPDLINRLIIKYGPDLVHQARTPPKQQAPS